jgi:hypothetical protein
VEWSWAVAELREGTARPKFVSLRRGHPLTGASVSGGDDRKLVLYMLGKKKNPKNWIQLLL